MKVLKERSKWGNADAPHFSLVKPQRGERGLQRLEAERRWVVWVRTQRNGNETKLPLNAVTGQAASCSDPDTWSTYADATQYVADHPGTGIGIVLGNGLAGVDLDDVRDPETGAFTEDAQLIVDALADAYCEVSPSGRGLHFLMRVDPGYSHSRKKGKLGEKSEIEVYTNYRYFTVTGDTINDVPIDVDLTEQLNNVALQYLPPKERALPPTVGTQTIAVQSDSAVLERMFDSAGPLLRALYDGDTSRYYNDHSSADLAMMNHLAYWTNGDREQMDRLFRRSGLMRDKWDVVHDPSGNRTYGQMTIDAALADFVPYESTMKGASLTEREEIERVHALPLRSRRQYLDTQFDSDRNKFQESAKRKTGFANWDAMQPFVPGLYIVGAVPSLGKTAFCMQLADQLAQNGETCIYFALEQTEEEMTARSISREARIIADNRNLDADNPTALDIRLGRCSPEVAGIVREARERVAEYSDRVFIVSTGFQTTWRQIDSTVKQYNKETGIVPTVFVDYVQLLKGSDRQTERQVMDEAIQALKRLQQETGVTVVAVSSVNRANYNTPLSFEAFKESGGLEFTADVLMGMDLEVIHSESFKSKRDDAEKRAILDEAKRARPRVVKLSLLKNRFGELGTLTFEYYSANDCFEPVEHVERQEIETTENDKVADLQKKLGIRTECQT